MKMHSYNFYNGHLSETERRLHALDNPSTVDKAPAYLYPSVENPQGTVAAVTTPEKKGKKNNNKTKNKGKSETNGNSNPPVSNDSDTDDEQDWAVWDESEENEDVVYQPDPRY